MKHRIESILYAALFIICSFSAFSQTASFHFVVTGDAHMYRYAVGENKIHMGFRDDLLQHVKYDNVNGPGDFIVVTGDMDPFRRVLQSVREVMGPDYPFYPVIGNHDVGGTNNHGQDFPEDNWQNAFDIIKYNRDSLLSIVDWGPDIASPGLSGQFEKDGITYVTFYDSAGIHGARYTSYSFDHGNSHFVVLDEYAANSWGARGNGRIWTELYNWLKKDLDATDKENIFVFGHEPLWISGTLADAPVSKTQFWDLLKARHVVAYFCGHIHDYAITDHDSVWEIRPSCAYEYTGKTHYSMVFVDSNVVKLKTYEMQADGFRMIDAKVLKGDGTVEPDNIPPVAEAGDDKTLFDADGDGKETLELNGTGSYDSDGKIVSYAWFEDTVLLGNDSIFSCDFSVGKHVVTLKVKDNDGAYDTDVCNITILGTVTSLENRKMQDKITLYPNPAHHFLSIRLPVGIAPGRLEMIDLNGKVFVLKNGYSDQYLRMDLNDYPAGIYFVKLFSGSTVFMSPFLLVK